MPLSILFKTTTTKNKQDLSLTLELTNLARLSGEQVPGILRSPLPPAGGSQELCLGSMSPEQILWKPLTD